MKICGKCGSELPENTKFCGRCGASVVPASPPPVTSATASRAEKTQPSPAPLPASIPSPTRNVPRKSGVPAFIASVLVGAVLTALLRYSLHAVASHRSLSPSTVARYRAESLRLIGVPRMHQYAPGDHWEYTLKARLHASSGDVFDATGSKSESIQAATFQGQTCLADTTITLVTRSDGLAQRETQITYFVQPSDQQGAFVELGDSTTSVDASDPPEPAPKGDAPTETRVLQRPTIIQVGMWSPPESFKTELDYTDGTKAQIVQRTEAGPTSVTWQSATLGNCWTVKQYVGDDGQDSITREVVCPFIGQAVTIDQKMSEKDKSEGEIHYDLVSYSLVNTPQ